MYIGYIYKITNNVKGVEYVGQTIDVRKRMNSHFCNVEENTLLKRAVLKYGRDNFSYVILHTVACSSVRERGNLLNELEKHYIEQYQTYIKGYNMTTGGDKDFTSRVVFTREHREKLREKATGKVVSEETKRRMSEARRGHKTPTEVRRKISESLMGHEITQDIRDKISQTKTGSKDSEEVRRKKQENLKKIRKTTSVMEVATGRVFETKTEACEFYKCSHTKVTTMIRKGILNQIN